MKFGPVPIAQAIGAVLAHGVEAARRPYDARSSYIIPKGTCLTQAHADDLRAEGVDQVVVARLEQGDVDENTAATRLAAAMIADRTGLSATVASAGRVNLRAIHAGIVDLDAEALHAVNRVCAGITIATVPQWQRLAENGLAATIKIIPYAVPEADLIRACAMGQGAMGLRGAVFGSASLIETRLDGYKAGDKGRRATVSRLGAFGVKCTEPVHVAHEVAALAAALRDAAGEVLLILTASATSDINDTAPCALQAAGGEVVHFGMPVDPGNLLFVGRLGDKPVIGLPGCARSPSLNGADWVLERTLCGVPIGPDEIMAMGVGGLLKEIPTRPRPRRNDG